MSTFPNTPRPVGQKPDEGIGHTRSPRSTAGNLYNDSGKEKGQDVNSSAPRQAANAMSPVSHSYTASNTRPTTPTSDSIHQYPSMRAESLLARKRIREAHDYSDFSSDSEPEDSIEQRQRKRARVEPLVNGQQFLRIGCHINEPNLPVFASVNSSNELVIQAIKENTPAEGLRLWDILLPNGPQLALNMIVPDKDLLPLSIGNLEDIDMKKLHRMVKDYTEAKEIHVGFHSEDSNLPVYACILTKSSGITYPQFKVLLADTGNSIIPFKNRLVTYHNVKYLKQYDKGHAEESRRAVGEDLVKILRSEAPINSAHTLQLPRTLLEQDLHGEGVASGENGQHASRVKLRKSLPKAARESKSTPEDAVELAARHVYNEIITLGKQIKTDAKYSEEKLRKVIKDQAQEIADLKATVSQMQRQIAAHQTQPPASLQRIDIERGLFESVTSDAGSPGMLMTTKAAAKERPVELHGKKYEEHISLLECRLKYTGVPTGEIIQHNGLSFRRVVDGTEEKFIQNLEPSSLVQAEGRQFLKWVTLKEPPPPQKKAYQGI